MFFICDCGKAAYEFGEDCPHCGKKIADNRANIDKEEIAERIKLFDTKQMRLFEC